LMLLAGAIVEGMNLNDASMAFTESTQSILPYLRGRSLAGVLMTVSHFVFAFHFGLMLFGLGRTASVPTFLNPVESEGSEAHL
jgi:cytochrome c oxidase cbb3-type subunit 1